jgi:autotransporter-associated beta strand protein
MRSSLGSRRGMVCLVRAAVAVALSTGFQQASAASFSWTGGGVASSLTNPGNWNASPVFDATADLTFDVGVNLTPGLTAPVTARSFTFGGSAGAFVINGADTNTLSLDGAVSITNNSSQVQNFGRVNFVGSTSTFSGSRGVRFNGSGRVLFGTGGSAVTLTNNISTPLSNTLNFASGANTSLFFLNNSASGTRTLTVNGTGTTVFGAVIRDSTLAGGVGAIVKSGTGTLVMGSTNLFSGGVTVSQGLLSTSVSSTGSAGAPTAGPFGTGTLTLAGGAVSSADNLSFPSVGNSVAVTGDVTLGQNTLSSTLTFTGPVSLGGGTRTLTVAGSTELTGVVSNGGIVMNNDPVSVAPTLSLMAANTFAGGFTLNSGFARLGSSTTGTPVTSGPFGTGPVVLSGGRVFSSAAVGTGNRTIANPLTIGGNVGLGSTGIATNGTLTFSGPADLAGGSRTVTIDSAVSFTGAISDGVGGPGSLTKAGSSVLVLSGASTFSGGFTLGAGTARVTVDSVGTPSSITSSPVGTGPLALNGGTLASPVGVAVTFYNPLSIGGSVTLGGGTGFNGSLNFSSATATNLGGATRTLTVNTNTTINSVITNGGLSKAGSNNLTLTAQNTFTTNLLVSAASLRLAHPTNTLADSLNVTVTASGILNLLTDNTETVRSILVNGATAEVRSDNTYFTATSYFGRTGTFSGGLAGTSATLTKDTGGTVTFSGNLPNTYGGLTSHTGGAIVLSKLGTLGGLVSIPGNLRLSAGTLTSYTQPDQIANTSTVTAFGSTVAGTSGASIAMARNTDTIATLLVTSGGAFGLSGVTLNSGAALTAGTVSVQNFVPDSNTIPALIIGGNDATAVSSLTVGSGGLLMTGQTIVLNAGTGASAKGNRLVLNGNVSASGVNTIRTDGGVATSPDLVQEIDLGSTTRSFSITSGTTTIGPDGSNTLTVKSSAGLTKSGAGTLTFTSSLTAPSYTGGTVVVGGELHFKAPFRPVTGNLVSTVGGVVRLGATPTAISESGYTVTAEVSQIFSTVAGSVVVTPVDRAVNKASVVVTSGLTISAGGSVDLGTSDLILKGGAGSVSTVQSLVASGALRTSVGSFSSAPFTTLAVFANSAGDGVTPYFNSYNGVSVSGSDVIVKYTYVGDTNLDGVLDGIDLANVIEGYSTGQTGWAFGDVDNSGGPVTLTDWNAFEAAFNYFNASSPVSLGNGAGARDSGGVIPEPSALGLMLTAALFTRRRRRTELCFNPSCSKFASA